MNPLERRDGELWMEGARLADVAERFGTPCYVYSRAAIESTCERHDSSS